MKALYIRLDNFTKENTDIESRRYIKTYTCYNLASIVEDFKTYQGIAEDHKMAMTIFETKKDWERDGRLFYDDCLKAQRAAQIIPQF